MRACLYSVICWAIHTQMCRVVWGSTLPLPQTARSLNLNYSYSGPITLDPKLFFRESKSMAMGSMLRFGRRVQ